MAANAAIYIQQGSGDLTKMFDDVKSNKSLFRKATWYDVRLGSDIVRFNVMESAAVSEHVRGFLGYIASLDQDEARKKEASHVIAHTTVVLGMVTDQDFDDNEAISQSLFRIADVYDGLVFVHGSLLQPSGAVLVGPLLDRSEPNPSIERTAHRLRRSPAAHVER